MPKASIIVTGATGSMGRAAVKALAAKSESVIAVCRSRERGEKMVSEILAEFPSASVELALADLSSIASVNALCDALEGREIKGLFNNAGTLLRDYALSPDGLEMCVAVNYVAPFIICNRIGSRMAPGSRIVNMVSLTCKYSKLDRHFFEDGAGQYSQLGTYAKTKLALMMFTMEFARRHPSLYVNVSDPGVVNSNMISMGRWFDPLADIFFRPFISKPSKGVAPALRALDATVTGKLFVGSSVKEIPSRCRRFTDVDWLWSETEKISSIMKTIYLAGGCFWGTEHYIKMVRGVVATEVGFANGNTDNPTYKEVYTDTTGYAEAVRVDYDPKTVSLELLLELYFKAIDPLSVNKQGEDEGTRYRTGIYFVDEADKPVIDKVFNAEQQKAGAPLAVEVLPLKNFYTAEEYHQDYLDKNPQGYCHLRPELFEFAKNANK